MFEEVFVLNNVSTMLVMFVAAAVLVGVLVLIGRNEVKVSPVRTMVYSGVAIALGAALSTITLFKMPQGGSITPFSMLFILVVGYFFGVRQGVLAGIVYGLLQLVIGAYVVHPVQLLLDYPLAFGALGLSGLFAGSKFGLIKGVMLGMAGRLLMHVISGAVFFGEYAPEGMNVWLYSFWYNFTYIGVEGALTIILILVPAVILTIDRVKKAAIA